MGSGGSGLFNNTKGSNKNKVELPKNDAQLKHIFRDAKGHIPNTP